MLVWKFNEALIMQHLSTISKLHTSTTRIFLDLNSIFFKNGYARESKPDIQVLLAIPPGLENFPEIATVFFPLHNSNMSFLFRLEVIVRASFLFCS